jgi:hypothetical protein
MHDEYARGWMTWVAMSPHPMNASPPHHLHGIDVRVFLPPWTLLTTRGLISNAFALRICGKWPATCLGCSKCHSSFHRFLFFEPDGWPPCGHQTTKPHASHNLAIGIVSCYGVSQPSQCFRHFFVVYFSTKRCCYMSHATISHCQFTIST